MADYRWSKVSSLWIGGQLSWLENLCLSSFAARGYQVNLYSYEEIEVPEGVSLVDARNIIPEAEVFRNPSPSKSYAGFSNVFRYELLAQKPDEVWIDTDVLAGPLWLPDSEILMGYEDSHFVNGAIFRCPPNSPILTALRKEASQIDKSTFRWGELGPKLITKQVARFDLSEYVSSKRVFYPISSVEVWRMFSPKLTKQVEKAICESSTVHVWNEAFKISNADIKSFVPHLDSFIGKKATELGITFSSRSTLSEKALHKWSRRSRIQQLRNAIARNVLR